MSILGIIALIAFAFVFVILLIPTCVILWLVCVYLVDFDWPITNRIKEWLADAWNQIKWPFYLTVGFGIGGSFAGQQGVKVGAILGALCGGFYLLVRFVDTQDTYGSKPYQTDPQTNTPKPHRRPQQSKTSWDWSAGYDIDGGVQEDKLLHQQ